VGKKADHVVAFLRAEEVAAVVPRLLLTMDDEWQDTWLEIPEGQWHNHLTGDRFKGGEVMIRDILARFPVALVSKE
jgi:(1->4)-alpha-D-glucan 1-alpha-D-glucosylmutase